MASAISVLNRLALPRARAEWSQPSRLFDLESLRRFEIINFP